MGAGGIVFVQGLFGRGEKILRWAVLANIASSSIGVVMLIARPAASITNPFLTVHRGILGLTYFVVLYVLIRRVREGRRDAAIYLGGLSIHLVLGVRDVLVSVGVLAEHDPLAHWGMLALTIAGGWALLRRLSAMRRRVVEYAAALEVNARERELMLRDLHDGLGRITTNIAMLTEVARRQTDGNTTLQRISELAHAGTDEIRTFMQGLDEEGCDWDGLQAKMRHDASGVVEPLDGSFDLDVSVEAGAGPPSPYLYIQLLRVFQEGITNAVKHADKPRVRANLRVSGIEVVLGVENDGVRGPDAPEPFGINAGAGLASMQARATELGGSLEFERDDSMARLCLRVPVPLRYAEGAR
jgi:signal transduction histidine kinase